MERYPLWLKHRQTLEGVLVEQPVEETRLMATGLYVYSPSEVGVETTSLAGVPRRWVTALEGRGLATLKAKGEAMLKALWMAPLEGADVEELVLLDEIAKLVQLGLERRGLDIPEQLMRRQRQIGRMLERALEDRLEVAEAQLAAMDDPETRKKKQQKTVERLREQLEGPQLAQLMAPRGEEE